MENFSTTLQLNVPPTKIFNALTEKIPLWWSEMFEGASKNVGETFTIRFGENVFKKIRIDKVLKDKELVWFVEDSRINIPGLSNQIEWIATTIVWELKVMPQGTLVTLTHHGLNPAIECFEICSEGWMQFMGSLKLYLDTGTGKPFQL